MRIFGESLRTRLGRIDPWLFGATTFLSLVSILTVFGAVDNFGKKDLTYSFREIVGQKLYLVQGGSVIIELHMTDGRSVSLQSTMTGTYDFLDHAFIHWCRQTRRDPAGCDFHDTANHLWFPTLED